MTGPKKGGHGPHLLLLGGGLSDRYMGVSLGLGPTLAYPRLSWTEDFIPQYKDICTYVSALRIHTYLLHECILERRRCEFVVDASWGDGYR